jgi:hypothetical protein
MTYLMMGLGTGRTPEIDPAVRRHFDRCADLPDEAHPPAGELLAHFDKLIEALWGPRQFRPLTLSRRG